MSEVLHVASFDTPIGSCRAASTERGLAYLELPRAAGRGFDGHWRRHFPQASLAEGFAPNRDAVLQIVEFLEGKRRLFDLALELRGTPFELRVWQALLEIPYGETRSYSQVADAIGRPLAVRSVGNANGSNPLALVVPCHRVVAADGGLGGFVGGAALKARLLAMERDALAGVPQSAQARLL